MILTNLSNSNDSIGNWIFLSVLAFSLFLIIIFYTINKKFNKRVTDTSEYLKKINEINEQINFKTISSSSETKTFYLNSKRAFDNFDLYKRKTEFIKNNLCYYEQLIDDINFNVATLNEYNKQIKSIPLTNDETIAKENKMSLKSYNKREIKLGDKITKHPCTSYSLRIQWEYRSPAGRNYYYRYWDFSFDEVKSIVLQFRASINSHFYDEQKLTNQQSSKKIYTNDDIEDID